MIGQCVNKLHADLNDDACRQLFEVILSDPHESRLSLITQLFVYLQVLMQRLNVKKRATMATPTDVMCFIVALTKAHTLTNTTLIVRQELYFLMIRVFASIRWTLVVKNVWNR